MVRLKDYTTFFGDVASLLFQFHNGSIKRNAKALNFTKSVKFQFHNGSIKSQLISPNEATITSFNSTMVRLKVRLP